MRPLHGLALLFVLLALLVGGLLWFSRDSAVAPLAGPAVQGAPVATDAHGPEAQLSSTENAASELARAAVDTATTAHAAKDGANSAKVADGLFGRVVGADGKGLAGASVYAAPTDGFDFLPLDALDPKTMPWSKRADAVTDADGRFQLALASQAHVKLAVRASGYAPLDAERTLARGERDLGDVLLEQGVVLSGRVVDEQGRPVAGAELVSRPRGGGFAMPMMDRGRAPLAKTDAQGRFRVDRIASGPWRLAVSSEDHPDKSFNGETDRPGAVVHGLEFALDEGARIQGRVSGASGDKAAKLTVSAIARGENDDQGAMSFGPDGFAMPRQAKVATDGAFTLRGLKPNQGYRLSAREVDTSVFGGFGMGGGRGGQGVNAKSGDTGVEVPYTPEGAIVCQVVDAATGAPVVEMDVKAGAGFNLPLLDADNKPRRKFEDGKVRFERLPPSMGGRRGGGGGGGLKLRIDATGYRSYESAELTMVAGQDLDLGVIRLEHAPVCRVRVVDLASGAPVAGAEVTLREAGEDQGRGMGRMAMRFSLGGTTNGPVNDEGLSQATTGADGTVVLATFPGKQATLKVTHAEHATFQSPAFLLSESVDHQQTVSLARGGDVLVRVVDGQGRPVPSVEVEHAFGEETGENPWMRRMMGGGDTKSDARGEILFAHLQPGTHRFRLAAGDPGMRMFGGGAMRGRMVVRGVGGGNEDEAPEPEWTSIEVLEGAETPLSLLAPAHATLVGRIREGGKALPGATVALEERKDGEPVMPDLGFFGGNNRPKTGGGGDYKLEDVKPGKYVLRVSHPSRAMPYEADVEVTEGETRLDLDLPIGVVEGRVVGQDDKPIAGARVRAEHVREKQNGETQVEMVMSVVAGGEGGDTMAFAGPAGEMQRTDADGRYTLRGVTTGVDLVVRVNAKDVSPASSEKFRVAPDQTVRNVDFKLKQGGTAEITVTRGGQPARGVVVQATRTGAQGDSPHVQVTNSAGLARFTGLEPGAWRFESTDFSRLDDPAAGEPAPVTAELEIAANQTQKHKLDLP